MVSLGSGFSSQHRMRSAQLSGIIYLVNDWDPMQRWDGISGTLEEAGIDPAPTNWAPVPATAPGNSEPGEHTFRYRYKDSRTGYVSQPSNAVTITVAAGGEQLTFTIAAAPTTEIAVSADAKADQIVLEATLAGGEQYFLVDTVPNAAGTIVFDVSDDTLVGQTFDWPEDGNGKPPYFKLILEHKGRLLGAGHVLHTTGTATPSGGSPNVTGSGTDWKEAAVGRRILFDGDTESFEIDSVGSATALTLTKNYTGSAGAGSDYTIFGPPNVIYESEPLFPESWPTLRFTKVLANKNDRLTAMKAYHDDVIVFGQHTMERWSYTESLVLDGQARPVAGNRGALNDRVVIPVEGMLFGFDREGIWRWAGGSPEHISHPIDPLIDQDEIDWSEDEKFFAVEIPRERTIRFYYVKQGFTDPRHFFEYDFDRNIWGTGFHEIGIADGRTIATANERRAALVDTRGNTWLVGGCTDGADPETTLIGTADGTPTQTVIDILEAGLQTADGGLQGVGAYWVEGDETSVIDSNTAGQVTLVSPGFSGAPAPGDTIYIGRIHAKLRTKALTLQTPKDAFEPRYLHTYFKPLTVTPQRFLYVKAYDTWDTSARTAGITVTDVTKGVDVVAGQAEAIVDLDNEDGYGKVPIRDEFQRVMEFEFEIRQPCTEVEFLGMDADGQYDEVERQG